MCYHGTMSSGLSTVLSVADSQVVADLGGGDEVSAAQCAPPGIDAPPLPGDTAVCVEYSKSGEQAAVAAIVADQKAKPGELRLFSRDTDRELVATVWLRDDGSIVIETADGGKLETNADGVTVTGDLTVTGALSVAGAIEGASVTDTTTSVGLGTHVHVLNGPVLPTSPPTPGT